MTGTSALRCDGCGQAASPEHVARRLRRLEWTTRYRPVHISNLFLGAFSPREDGYFLYSPGGEFGGEAGQLLRAVGIATEGKTADAVLSESQRAGFFLTHVLECPPEDSATMDGHLATLLTERLPSLASRIRRSLKPKRVILVTRALQPIVQNIVMLNLGCPVLVNDGKPFGFSELASERDFLQLREKLAGTAGG